MQVLILVEVVEHYRDNIAYQDNLLNIIEHYRDIIFPLSHSPSINVFSTLGLGCIVISDLVVANLFVHSLSGTILLYLAALFLH